MGSQGEVVHGSTRHIGRVVDSMRPWDCVWQSALVGHVIMLMGGFMVTVTEDRQG
jgi:hypothetical protein